MNPHQLKEFSQSILAVSLFSSNILFWKQSDYFDADSALKPLLHTWSLGIEEQYYFFFPILVILAWRFAKGKFLVIFRFIAIVSFLTAQKYSKVLPSETFYLIPTRAWELLLGSLVAFGFLHTPLTSKRLGTFSKQIVSIIGFLSIILSIYFLNPGMPYPSVWALPTTIGTACIILFATRETYVGSLLSNRILVWIGLLSYSAYLWHQPILAFLKSFIQSNELTYLQYLIYFTLMFCLAFFTYIIVETPFRRKLIKRSNLFLIAFIGSIFFIVIGYFGHITKGFLELKLSGVPIEKRMLLLDVELQRRNSEKIWSKHSPYLNSASFDKSLPSRKVVFIGDSMARDLSTAIVESSYLFPNQQFRLISQSHDCLEINAKYSSHCNNDFKYIKSSSMLKDADLIVITYLWQESDDFPSIKNFFTSIKNENQNILILGSAGFIDMASISYDLTRFKSFTSQEELDKFLFKKRRLKFENGNSAVKKIANDLSLNYFDRKDFYCNNSLHQCKMISLESGSVLWDNAHLTFYGMGITAKAVSDMDLFKNQ